VARAAGRTGGWGWSDAAGHGTGAGCVVEQSSGESSGLDASESAYVEGGLSAAQYVLALDATDSCGGVQTAVDGTAPSAGGIIAVGELVVSHHAALSVQVEVRGPSPHV